ncbi:hypothetical protein TWF788_004659 [Orbilia oligospora]|uniref:Uncharacterized protein n=1 Tax=Orbilia oligospora TaxID=2813651 RepID=A0A7C8TY02_ORBOL|nr:hypothetical protein TWF788_004659 [Orbilia oligospora]
MANEHSDFSFLKISGLRLLTYQSTLTTKVSIPTTIETQFLGHERHGYGLLADSERIDVFVVPTPTMTNSFVNIRRRTQPSSNL